MFKLSIYSYVATMDFFILKKKIFFNSAVNHLYNLWQILHKYFWQSGLKTCFCTDCYHTTIIIYLNKKYFLFCDQAWKHYPVYIISQTKCITSIIHLSESIFCFMAWLKNILHLISSGKPVWQPGLKTWFCGDYQSQQSFP